MSQHEIDTTDAPARAPAQATRAHPRPGSSLHYAALLMPSRQRRAGSALLRLWLNVASIPMSISDPGVAETKLRWWAQEWERAAAGTAQHPLTISLTKALRAANSPWPDASLWFTQIEAWVHLTHQNRWLNQEALDLHLNDSTGQAARMAAQVPGCCGAPSPAALSRQRTICLACCAIWTRVACSRFGCSCHPTRPSGRACGTGCSGLRREA